MVLSTAPRIHLSEDGFLHSAPEALALIPHAVAVKYSILAHRVENDELHVVIPEGSDDESVDRIRVLTGMRVHVRSASRELIRRAIAIAYADPSEISAEVANDPPAIRAVDAMHEAAVQYGASDVHVEPDAQGGRMRFRVDGSLVNPAPIPPHLYLPIVSRIKLLASLDIAERRAPQDGSYTAHASGRTLEARVSTIPTIAGERVVVRLLDTQSRVPSLATLGMDPTVLAAYRRVLHSSHGFIVVCGPTGSGKTTTLYASLAERNVESQHVCSVEDPVEIRMHGIAQVQVNVRAGVSFESALRAFLRQDPNVIMLGEMRDEQTARVALSASLAGQIVLTTLHASDAVRAIDRLAELGLDRQTLASGLTAIVGQRLLRTLCGDCSGARSSGCGTCHDTGYRGRIGIFELLLVTDDIRQSIADGIPAWQLASLARERGYVPLASAARSLVERGTTKREEARRVLNVEEGEG